MIDGVGGLFTTAEMAGVFSGRALVEKMLAFEAGLARAEARAGVISPEAAGAIEAGCRVELFDVQAVFREAATAGTPAIPLVRMLTEQVDEGGRDFVHWGATSQDAIDTALMLQMREGLGLIVEGLMGLGAACARLAEEHRHTLMPGRTLMQQALPITFGLKAARWLAMTARQVRALRECRERVVALQFGGAAGTLALLGEKGMPVAELLAEELDLPLPDLPWHAERDRPATIALALGVTAGAMGKIAGDIVLLAQTEVGEVAERGAPGKGGSSAMPQKRNPVDSTLAAAASRLALGQAQVVLGAMSQEHERAAGGWQAEWAGLPALFCYVGGALDHARRAMEGLEVNEGRMRENLDAGGGLLMSEALLAALSRKVGRREAQRLAREAGERTRREGRTLLEVASEEQGIRGQLSAEELERAFDPTLYLGSADLFIDRALDGYREVAEAGGA